MSWSSFTGAMGEVAKGAVGIVQKAVLILHTDENEALGEDTGTLVQSALSTSSKASAKMLGATMGAGFHAMEVQYNPASLSLTANAQDTPMQFLQGNLDSAIPAQFDRKPSVVLSVDLWFDDMDINDSFMLLGQNLTLAGLGKNIASLVMKKTHSVQKKTNGLVASCLRENTRFVTFKWADMTFTGQITEVQATYTMFSTSGRPVRSKVKVNITQTVTDDGESAYWEGAFDKAFSAGGQGTLGRSLNSRGGNIMNFNM